MRGFAGLLAVVVAFTSHWIPAGVITSVIVFWWLDVPGVLGFLLFLVIFNVFHFGGLFLSSALLALSMPDRDEQDQL